MSTAQRSLLLLSLGFLFVMGLVMIFNTSSAEVIDHNLDRGTHGALLRQLAYAGIGGLSAVGMRRLGYAAFIRYSPLLLTLFTVLLVLVFVPGIGRAANGSHRWIHLGMITFQPSEFVKILVPAFFIYHLEAHDGDALSLRHFARLVGLVAIPGILILIEPNHGSVGVIGVLFAMLCFLAGVRMKYWALPMAVLLIIGVAVAYNHPYVAARLNVYLHPEMDLQGKGHQPYQAKIAAGSGGFLGKGPGQSLQKLSYLPEAQNDYIAAIFAEEFGFLGMLALVSSYLVFASIGFSIASVAVDRSGCYLAASLTFLICFQAFLNLGVVSGLLPSTGLNLPFFSQGGSSLIANLIAMGLICSVADKAKQPDGQSSQSSESGVVGDSSFTR